MFIHCSVMALTLSAMFRNFVELQITSNPEFSLPSLLCLDMSCWLCRQQSHLMTENMILVLLFRQRWGCNHCWLHALRLCWSRSKARMQKLELAGDPSSGTFCRLGSKRRKQGISSGQCSHCLLCLSFRSTTPSLPVLLVNMVVLPVQRKPV